MLKLLIIGLGGFIGAISRYTLSGAVHRIMGESFPYGTLVVNVLGCLLLGGLIYFIEDRAIIGPNLRLFLTIGILGAFTTFSTFGYETFQLMRDGQLGLTLANLGANVFLGVIAVWLGRAILKALNI
ncbi:MAG: fluoride efflux transporter CrcB [candidate division Zixibacteria bacterium]|nr:fluoride efflux transporter CrcB [candidate division Zixibacteria bacterium]